MFEAGKEIVCVDNKGIEDSGIKIGAVYMLIGIKKRCNCGFVVNIGLKGKFNAGAGLMCPNCFETYEGDGYRWFLSTRFVPLDSISITEALEVLQAEAVSV